MPNYAEIQARFDRGDVTEAEARRHGANNRAYDWACNPPHHWAAHLQAAYRDGFNTAADTSK